MLAGPAAEDDGDAGLAAAWRLAWQARSSWPNPSGLGLGRIDVPPTPPDLAPHPTRLAGPARPTVAVTAGRPAHEPDAPLNTPITMASTYVAGGDVEYGRYGNPTWTALEDALGALEGGRCLAFASGLAAVARVLDLVGTGAKVVAPRHAYNGTVMQLADLEARGRLTCELVDITDTAAVVAACDGGRPGLAGVADQPGPGGRRHRDDHRRGARGRRLRRRRQHLRHSPAPDAAGGRASTSWCTRRRSTSPGTATC